MAPRRNKHARLFLEVALQRFEDALILIRAERTNASIYLAGYAIECGLKALVMDNTTDRRQERVLAQFRGHRGHDLDWLRAELVSRRIHIPNDLMAHFRRINTWTTTLRYRPGRIPMADARALLKSVRELLDWIEGM